MTANILMLILTLAEGGLYSAAFVNTQTQVECERRASMVRAILEASDTRIERIECRPSEARFEPFVHGPVQSGTPNRYLIRLNGEQAVVEPLASGQPCPAEGESAYCATSSQKRLTPEP